MDNNFTVNPEKVINHLANRIAFLEKELAIANVLIQELENTQSEENEGAE